VGCSAIVCFIFIPNLIAQLSALLRWSTKLPSNWESYKVYINPYSSV
jgi:hypothetical protein